jgi:tetratricopeptide (TPR) repeat protein
LLGLALLAVIGTVLYFAWNNFQAWRLVRAGKEAEAHGDYRGANNLYRDSLSYWPGSDEAHFLLARTHRRLREFDAAQEQLRECERLNWSPETVEMERTLLRAQQNEFAEVEAQLVKRAGEEGEEAAAAAEVLTAHYLATQRTRNALHWASRLLELAPDNAQALLWMARVREQLGGPAGALDYFRRAAEALPTDDRIRQTLAEALLQANQPGEALPHWEQLRERHPDSPEVLFGLARAYRGVGKLGSSRRLLDRLLAETDSNPETIAERAFRAQVLTERGQVAWKAGQPARAEKWLKQALRLAPTKHDALYTLSLCLQEQGPGRRAEAARYRAQWKKVMADTKRLDVLVRVGLRQARDNPAVPFEIGTLCLKYGKVERGLAWLREALRLDPGYPPAHQALAEYYQGIGDKKQAARHRQLARGLVPPDADDNP